MTSYRLWPSTSGPASPVAFGGNFLSGTVFGVAGGGNWFEGYWWWVGSSGQSTSPVKCALWSMSSGTTGSLVPGSVVTSGTLTAGAWNWIPLTAPVQLAPCYSAWNSTYGGSYIAAIGVNGAFPDTSGYWGGTGAPGRGGITSGPLVAYSAKASDGGTLPAPQGLPQGVFTTAGSDPSVTIPVQQSSVDNFWVDVQVTNTVPPGYAGTYRLYPNTCAANDMVTGDAAFNYTVATEVRLAKACTLVNVWFFVPNGATTLATRCEVWDISSGLSVAAISSPAWKDASGGSFALGENSGFHGAWASAAFAANTTLPAGSYRVSVYNSSGVSDANWSAKDATTDFWAESNPGVGSGGITWGPLYAPDYAHASAGYLYGGPGTATPPYANGTVAHAQPVFGQTPGGSTEFPNLYAPVGPGLNQTQNYWVDLEVAPLAVTPAVTLDAEAVSGSVTRDIFGGSVI